MYPKTRNAIYMLSRPPKNRKSAACSIRYRSLGNGRVGCRHGPLPTAPAPTTAAWRRWSRRCRRGRGCLDAHGLLHALELISHLLHLLLGNRLRSLRVDQFEQKRLVVNRGVVLSR